MAGRVLVVDDEESILITMKAVLEQANYAVATASTGAVAAHLLQEAMFDVALVDLRLDDMDGLEIMALLRQHSPDTVPIVLTGYASLDTALGALRGERTTT
jgi:DNA-binding NtrC family response regulator